MNTVKKEVYLTGEQQTAQNEALELERRIKADKEKLAALRKNGKGITLAVCPTKRGSVGFTIHGLGMPKFFYKQHAFKLLEDSEDGYALRQMILEWIVEHDKELSDKE